MATTLDRVYFATSTTGTGSIAEGSAETNYRNLSTAETDGDLSDGDDLYYVIEDGTAWEVGLGTWATAGNTLARTTIYRTSTGGTSAISLSGSAKVFITDVARQNNNAELEELVVAASNEDFELESSTSDALVSFRMPYAMTLTGVKADVVGAPTGSAMTVDVHESGTTIFSTKITIDATETTSETAATASVISDSALGDNNLIEIFADAVGSTYGGNGLKVTLIGRRT